MCRLQVQLLQRVLQAVPPLGHAPRHTRAHPAHTQLQAQGEGGDGPAHTHTYTHTHTHTHTHTYSHVHTHTYICRSTHTHTHTQTLRLYSVLSDFGVALCVFSTGLIQVGKWTRVPLSYVTAA